MGYNNLIYLHSMLTKSTKLKYKLRQTNSEMIRALFLESENLPDQSLFHLNKTWPNLSSLFLGCNHFTLLDGLEICAFPQLTELCLKGNRIESVEILCQVWMPNLKKLTLKNNRICTVRSLRKLQAPNLQHISLQRNYIKDFDKFFQLDCSSLKVLELEFSNTRTLSEDMRWLFKLGFPEKDQIEQFSNMHQKQSISKMNELFCKSLQRISQVHIIHQLKLKFVHAIDSINL